MHYTKDPTAMQIREAKFILQNKKAHDSNQYGKQGAL